MTHPPTNTLRNAYERYIQSNNYTLEQCYCNHSRAKQNAFDYCRELEYQNHGYNLKIIGFNSQTFSVGFIGEIGNKKAFFYITRDYDRFILLEEI